MKPLIDLVSSAQFKSIAQEPVIMLEKEDVAGVYTGLCHLFVAIVSARDVSESLMVDPGNALA